jgi:hypothetical protein
VPYALTTYTGRIHVSEPIYEQVKDDFNVVKRGVINVKGKGEMTTYLISVGDYSIESIPNG